MSDQITDSPSTAAATTSNDAVLTPLLGLFAVGMTASFFLPWLTFLGFRASGFDLVQKYGGASNLLWAIPFFGVVALFAAIGKSNLKVAASVAGMMPMFALCYGFCDSGADLLKVLDSGAYVGIGAGLALMIFAVGLKK